jgi:predicted nucleic acid-binding Zn ribbon protein
MARSGKSESSGKRRQSRPVPIQDALRHLATSLGIAGTLRQYDILNSWETIVGEQIARVATPERIERGTLFVAVESAPWRAELAMRRQEILLRINTAIGHKVLKEIRFL